MSTDGEGVKGSVDGEGEGLDSVVDSVEGEGVKGSGDGEGEAELEPEGDGEAVELGEGVRSSSSETSGVGAEVVGEELGLDVGWIVNKEENYHEMRVFQVYR